MGDRSGDDSSMVIGFTEAELGLSVASVFLVLWLVGGLPEAPQTEEVAPEVGITADSAAILSAKLDSLTALADSTAKLRSRLWPSCTDRGVAAGAIASITVLGRDSLRLDGRVQTVDAFIAGLGSTLANASSNVCFHQLNVRLVRDLDAESYDRMLRRLRQHFYVILLGVEGS